MDHEVVGHVFSEVVREQCAVCCHIADADTYRRIAGVVGGEVNPYGVADSVKGTIGIHTYSVSGVGLEFRERPSLTQLVVGTGQYTVFIVNASKTVVLVAAPFDKSRGGG